MLDIGFYWVHEVLGYEVYVIELFKLLSYEVYELRNENISEMKWHNKYNI